MADYDYPMHLPLELLLNLPRDFELSTLVPPSRLIPSYSQWQDFRGASGYRWINGPMMPFQTAMPLNYDLAPMPSSYSPYGVASYACFRQPYAYQYHYHQPPPPSQRVRDGPLETPAVSVPQMYNTRTPINWTGHQVQGDGLLQTPTAIGVPQMYLVQPGFFGVLNPGTGVFHRPYFTGNTTNGPRRRRGSRGRRRDRRRQQRIEQDKVQSANPSSRRNGHSHTASGIFVPTRTASRCTI